MKKKTIEKIKKGLLAAGLTATVVAIAVQVIRKTLLEKRNCEGKVKSKKKK